MESDIEKYSGADQDEALSALIEYADDKFSNEHMVVALPYFFAGMRASEVATVLADVLNTSVPASTVNGWLANPDYKRVVASGRQLMAEWNLARIQQLSVMSMNYLATELAEPAVTLPERRHKAGIARFVIQQQSRMGEKESKEGVDVPSMLVGAQSMALVAQQIALAIEGKHRVDEERDVVIGKCEVIDSEAADVVNTYDSPVPRYGVLNIDFDEGTIQCHICNMFVTSLYQHIDVSHKISVEDYRGAYGIIDGMPLTFGGITNDRPDYTDMTAWRGSRIAVLDEEENLRPYDEPEDYAADSGRVEALPARLGNELPEAP